MPIVTVEVLKNEVQADGRRKLSFELTDDTGRNSIFFRGRVPNDFNISAELVSIKARLTASLIVDELELAVDRVEAGENSLDVTNDYKEATQKQTAKYLIRHMIRTRSVYCVLAMEPLVEFIKATYTEAQIKSFLDITSAQLTKLNIKYNSVINNKADILAADTQEDWG